SLSSAGKFKLQPPSPWRLKHNAQLLHEKKPNLHQIADKIPKHETKCALLPSCLIQLKLLLLLMLLLLQRGKRRGGAGRSTPLHLPSLSSDSSPHSLT
ncbi:hypothetical protein ATANTOWER_003593, partial [Ataeniobius toweri]|nr:hypothetical protein [Ataeniobius toweri]